MFYSVLWDVLVATGLVYLPFLVMLLDYWKDSAATAEITHASQSSLRLLELEIFIAMFVIVLAAQPVGLTSIRAHAVAYTPPPTLNNPDPERVDFTTHDSTFGKSGFENAPHKVYTPVWWYAVMSVSSGITHAIVEGLPRASEIRQAVQLARLAKIEPAALQEQVQKFYTDCYTPARSKFLLEQPQSTNVVLLLHEQGEHDTEWLGSHIFRTEPGYYDTLRATDPTMPWVYDPTRDTEYAESTPPKYGRPYCKEWWERETVGLRDWIVIVSGRLAGFHRHMSYAGYTHASEEFKDAIAKLAIQNSPTAWTSTSISENNLATKGFLGSTESFVKQAIGGVGATAVAATGSVFISVLLHLLPMLQAILLFCIYALLPLYLVYSRFSFRAMVDGALAIFTIKFWTVLWYLAQWLDQNLITAMYPDMNLFLEYLLLNKEQVAKRYLLNFATTLLYIGLPLFWSIMSGWAGVRLGQSIESATSPYSGIARDSARSGVNIAKRVAR